MASGAAHSGGAVNDLLSLVATYWWLLLIFGGAIGTFLRGVRDFFLDMARYALGSGERRHQRRLEVIREQRGHLPAPPPPEEHDPETRKMTCRHPFESIEDVYSAGQLVAHLCVRCGTQLEVKADGA